MHTNLKTYIYKLGTKYKATVTYHTDANGKIHLISGVDELGEEFNPNNYRTRFLQELKPQT